MPPRRTTQTKTVDRRQRIVQYVTVKKQLVQCEPIYVRLGSVIRERRLRLGLTQEQLAARINLTRTSLCNIEIGRQRVLLSDLWDIARALETSPRALFNQLEG